MSQNTSHAVMSQRHEALDSADYFPTPPWATRALCEHVLLKLFGRTRGTVSEPACGEGDMAQPLEEYFDVVYASDIHDYGFGAVIDFLSGPEQKTDYVITNPPFRLGEQFALRGIGLAHIGTAMLVRSAFVEGRSRYSNLFKPHPPLVVAQFVERVPIVRGRLDPSASSATAYCWIVWGAADPGYPGTRFMWIPPCRKELERPGDYGESRSAAGKVYKQGALGLPEVTT